MIREPARALLLLFLGAATAAAAAAAKNATSLLPRVLLYVPLHATTDTAALAQFARCTLSKPAGAGAGFDVLLVVSGAGARRAATVRGDEFASILTSALDKAAAAAATAKTAETATTTTTTAVAASRPASPPLFPSPTITIDYLELPPEKDGYSSVENSFAGPNSAFFDAFLDLEKTPEDGDDDDGKSKRKKKRKTTSTVFDRHVRGQYPLVLQLEADVCATGPRWLDAALQPLVAVVEGKEKEKSEVRRASGPRSRSSSPRCAGKSKRARLFLSPPPRSPSLSPSSSSASPPSSARPSAAAAFTSLRPHLLLLLRARRATTSPTARRSPRSLDTCELT